jgi:hypothetical protein
MRREHDVTIHELPLWFMHWVPEQPQDPPLL